MNILFCGTCLPREFEMTIKDLSAAGNQFQINMIKSLNMKHNIMTISYLNIDCGSNTQLICDKCKKINIIPVFAYAKLRGCLNFRKQLIQLLKWADLVICYNIMYPWFGLPVISKKYHVKSISVIADFTPPIEEKKFLKKIIQWITQHEFSHYDKVVMLSEQIRKYLKSSQEQIVINGCVDAQKFAEIKQFKYSKDPIIITYSGLLSKITGVDLLLDALSKIPISNIKLVITGKGDMEIEELIRKRQVYDKRIEFKGFVEYHEYLQLLNNTCILINPRNMDYLQNQTNFPSKILEYLLAGRTIISTRFNGWERYKDYIVFCDSNSSEMAKIITQQIKKKEVLFNLNFKKNREYGKTFDWKNQISNFL